MELSIVIYRYDMYDYPPYMCQVEGCNAVRGALWGVAEPWNFFIIGNFRYNNIRRIHGVFVNGQYKKQEGQEGYA